MKEIFKNRDLLVIEKEFGVSVHNAEDNNNLLVQLSKIYPKEEFFPVHRLDKETSGIQLFARSVGSAKQYAELFQSRNVDKIYLGVVKGTLKEKSGVWNWPISDKSEGRRNPQGLSNNRISSETHFRVIAINKYFSMIEFDLKTGRQHQIRKHAAISGHPLIGDERYNDPKYNQRMVDIYKINRMMLHHSRLKLGEFEFTSEVPLDFQNLFNEFC